MLAVRRISQVNRFADVLEEIPCELPIWICFGSAHKGLGDCRTVIHFPGLVEFAGSFAAPGNDNSSKGNAVRKSVRGVNV
jgi:hypothetical protein